MKIRVASVQMHSENGDYEGNRARAQKLIGMAARRKAQLILIPEFALAGYRFTDDIWEMAEPLHGRTGDWLKSLSMKHRAYIGTCILERDGTDFYDTFILTGPGKDEFWHHRKIEPAFYEAFYFKGGGANPNVFDTPLGRIGVSICFDSSKTHSLKMLSQGAPALVLIPFSCPGLARFIPGRDRKNWDEQYTATPLAYSRCLGVPVVTSNKTGAFESPLPMSAGLRVRSAFLDCSQIVDARGNVVAKSGAGEDVIVAGVELPRAEDMLQAPFVPGGRWMPGYTAGVRFSAWYSNTMGRLRYAMSSARKRAAESSVNNPESNSAHPGFL